MITETRAKLTTAELIAELNRLSDERIEALRKAGIEPFVETERSAEEQRRAGRAIYEWRRRRLEARKEDEG
ncbi:MAG TPA: hypothetical protein VI837_00620 [Blastocatellia bacterium]|nr:hypothetical protein [Blastocatellia bacterium]